MCKSAVEEVERINLSSGDLERGFQLESVVITVESSASCYI